MVIFIKESLHDFNCHSKLFQKGKKGVVSAIFQHEPINFTAFPGLFKILPHQINLLRFLGHPAPAIFAFLTRKASFVQIFRTTTLSPYRFRHSGLSAIYTVVFYFQLISKISVAHTVHVGNTFLHETVNLRMVEKIES